MLVLMKNRHARYACVYCMHVSTACMCLLTTINTRVTTETTFISVFFLVDDVELFGR